MKTGLVLSGGADNGAYEAGAIMALAEAGLLDDLAVITGTSTGAINAAGYAQWLDGDPDQLRRAAYWLVDMWQEQITGPRSVRRQRFPPLLASLWKPSLYKTWPLWELLQRLVDVSKLRQSSVHCLVTATSLQTGQVHLFDQHHPEFLKGVYASAAIPWAFEPVEIGGELFVDGFLDTVPLGHAINAGADRLFVIVAQNRERKMPKEHFTSAFRVADRAIKLYGDETVRNDLTVLRRANEAIAEGRGKSGHRHIEVVVIEPTAQLGDSTNFDPDEIEAAIKLGKKDAKPA